MLEGIKDDDLVIVGKVYANKTVRIPKEVSEVLRLEGKDLAFVVSQGKVSLMAVEVSTIEEPVS